jgi:hypothetical protein
MVSAAELAPPANLAKPPAGKLVDLNFKVDPDFHTLMKVESARRRISMVEMMKMAMTEYFERNPAP